ncbi:MAG TPA: menaquinone biosynthesis protein [Pyrinomonadaceae bacterium]
MRARPRLVSITGSNRTPRGKIINANAAKEKPRIAASSYLNSAPLIWSFTRGSLRDAVIYIDAVPSRCADLLATGDADFGLVPVIEYQRIPGVRLVPQVCVGSHHDVKSVLLVSRLNNLKKIRSVALDDSSRTSVTLTKVIFQEFLSIEPTWATSSPDLKTMLRENDAALMIGDPAMTFAREGLNVWDLVSLWNDFTGTGFVFAMWMEKAYARNELVSLDFARAREEGIHSIDKIVDDYQDKLGLSGEELRDYLTNSITFDLNHDLQRGMELYFELAAQHGFIDRRRPLQFLGMQDSNG